MTRPLTLILLLISTLAQADVTPLQIGDTFTLESKVLSERRTINVYLPAAYQDEQQPNLPVLYMPDGGIGEDFLHVAGLVQIGSLNGTMRPHILVGIENTQRRRDLTGPTEVAEDKEIAPVVGGSAKFRQFIRDELMPVINQRYRTTGETAIMGESLAGLFVTETLLLEPDLFDTYIAIDPSLWWNNQAVSQAMIKQWPSYQGPAKRLYLAAGNKVSNLESTQALASQLHSHERLSVDFIAYPDENHGTIYHPAALDALRKLFPLSSSE